MTMFFMHAGFMSVGVLLMMAGFVVVRFLKSKPWWLKRHKGLQMVGAVFLMLGLTSAYLLAARHNGPHFSALHTYCGGTASVLAALTLGLGPLLFRWKTLTLRLKTLHRWSGRITLIMLWITVILGLRLAGIV